jgi:hypothetical protein
LVCRFCDFANFLSVLSLLLPQRVIANDEKGDLKLGSVGASGSPGSATMPANTKSNAIDDIMDDDDKDEHACVICLELFEVDDIVSWSRHSTTCHHVFHTECIEPWLLE